MKQQIQIRIGNFTPDEWEIDFLSQIEDGGLKSSVELLDNDSKGFGSSAAVDSQVVVAAINGGVSIIVALIPIIVNLFREKSKTPPIVINVVLHGTINSQRIQATENNISEEILDEVFSSIGDLTEVDVN